MVMSAAEGAQRSRLPQMAAALSYRTIFGLIPVIAVALIALKAFTTKEDMTRAINEAMQYTGLASIAVEEQELVGPPLPVESGDPSAHAREAKQERLDDWIGDLVNRVMSLDMRAITIIGLGALIYAALSMLVEVERAFNQIYRVPIGRSWVRRITHYWTLLTLMPLGLFATFAVGQRVSVWLSDPANLGGLAKGQVLIVGAAGYLSTVGISMLLFLLAYTVVPNTRVKFVPALIGALLAAILWEAGKWGFTQYVRYSAGYSRLYGSIALIPLFLLWVYVTWCVVLVGLNVAYYLQVGRHGKAEAADCPPPSFVDPASILTLMATMARRFHEGQPVDPPMLASKLALHEPIVVQMLERLARAGMILRVEHEERPGYFALARPPEGIDAEHVLRIGEELSGQVRPGPEELGAFGEAMRQSRRELVHNRTLASILESTSEGVDIRNN
jgi:membrane protein